MTCLCCGEPTQGGRFLPGHDARYASQMNRTLLTRSEVLRFNSRWTKADREQVSQVIEQYRPHHMYVVKSGQYVSGRDQNEEPLFWVSRGFISVPDPDHEEGERVIAELSTRMRRDGGTKTADRAGEVCEVCWLERSASGSCDCT